MEEGTLIPQLQRLRSYFPRGALELRVHQITLTEFPVSTVTCRVRVHWEHFWGTQERLSPPVFPVLMLPESWCTGAHPALCPDLPVLSFSKPHTSPKWEEIPLPTMFRHKNIHSILPVSIYHSWNSISPMRLATRLVRPSHHLLILWSY